MGLYGMLRNMPVPDVYKRQVYNCFGMDMPVPAGYEENEFGFLFAAPGGGAVCTIVINQPGFIALGALQVGDEMCIRDSSWAL